MGIREATPSGLADFSFLVSGGTGSFGSTMARHLLRSGVAEVRVLSRDEAKQDALRSSIGDPRMKFFLGDVRDVSSVERAVKGVDYVFHAAALKQVPSCEFFPMEATKTNVNGSTNVAEASIRAGVKSAVFLSTDKAVYPINAMGMSKALMEKSVLALARECSPSDTKINVTRYGNVMMSRGSVIPLFINQIQRDGIVTVTNETMTRFLMSLDDSVDLVLHAFRNGQSGDLFVKQAPAATLGDLVQALGTLLGSKPKVETIGTRHGEKLHESLLSAEERATSVDEDGFFRVPLDSRTLDYKIFTEEGSLGLTPGEPYTSANTRQLEVDELVRLLKQVREVKEALDGA